MLHTFLPIPKNTHKILLDVDSIYGDYCTISIELVAVYGAYARRKTLWSSFAINLKALDEDEVENVRDEVREAFEHYKLDYNEIVDFDAFCFFDWEFEQKIQEVVMEEDRMMKWAELSSGLEPVFQLKYKRRKKINPNDTKSRFEYRHLPDKLQVISRNFYDLAREITTTLSPGPERTVALRKLLEAKDAAVRAKVHPGG